MSRDAISSPQAGSGSDPRSERLGSVSVSIAKRACDGRSSVLSIKLMLPKGTGHWQISLGALPLFQVLRTMLQSAPCEDAHSSFP